MINPIKKVTLAIAMLPLLASAPVFAAGPITIVQPQYHGLIQLAQAGDPRLNQLQEQVRDLSGKVEELNFQILQMQEQMRKVQEDNEFRFEELEKSKRSDAGSKGNRSLAEATPAANHVGASQDASTTDGSANSVAIGNSAASNSQAHDRAPQQLGSVRMDANGNVIGETMDTTPQPVINAPESAPHDAEHGVASLPEADDPNALYQAAYQYILAGDYKAAETAFRAHVDRYPADPMTADARYWLGEALYGQKRYSEAATVFIDTQRDYPESKRGAENMLKLGMTLQKMDNNDVACATFEQIPARYPKATPAVMKRINDERSRIHC